MLEKQIIPTNKNKLSWLTITVMFLIFAGFVALIIFIVNKFLEPEGCYSPKVWNSLSKTCLPACPDKSHYDDKFNCVPTCDAGTDYDPNTKKCVSCNGIADIRHSGCKDSGENSCGPDCTKRNTKIDPSGKGGKGPFTKNKQIFNCDTKKCYCETNGYDLCILTKGDESSSVCYNKKLASCICDDQTGVCKVTGCESQNFCNDVCCQNKTDVCCNGLCCAEGQCKNIPGVDGETYCCSGEQIPIKNKETVTCCDKSKIYCSDSKGTTTPVIWDSGIPKCSAGNTLKCCGNPVCIDKVGNSSCCDSGDNDVGCGSPSLCVSDINTFPKTTTNDKLKGACIGVIIDSCQKSSSDNCVNACVNTVDFTKSTFNDGVKSLCQSDEKIMGVTYSMNNSHCSSDTQCLGSSNIGKMQCYNSKLNNWSEPGNDGSCQPNTVKRKPGECLKKCDDGQLYCPDDTACVESSGNGNSYCKTNKPNFNKSTEWPLKINDKSVWGQIYKVKKGDYCPIGELKCSSGESCSSIKYYGLDGKEKSLQCINGLCMASPDTDLNQNLFCRVNYESPPVSTTSNLSGMSFLSNNPYPYPESDNKSDIEILSSKMSKPADCTPSNFNNNSTSCGGEDSYRSLSFPWYVNTKDSPYTGPLHGGITGLHAWECGDDGGTIDCNVGNSKSYNILNKSLGTEALQNGDWYTYNKKSWTAVDSKQTGSSCYSLALSEVDNDSSLKLVNVTWEPTSGLCEAEYDPSNTPSKLCDDTDKYSCFNQLSVEGKKITSGLVCADENNTPNPGLLTLTNKTTGPDKTTGVLACSANWV